MFIKAQRINRLTAFEWVREREGEMWGRHREGELLCCHKFIGKSIVALLAAAHRFSGPVIKIISHTARKRASTNYDKITISQKVFMLALHSPTPPLQLLGKPKRAFGNYLSRHNNLARPLIGWPVAWLRLRVSQFLRDLPQKTKILPGPNWAFPAMGQDTCQA